MNFFKKTLSRPFQGKKKPIWARLFKINDDFISLFVKILYVDITNTLIFLLEKCVQKILTFSTKNNSVFDNVVAYS